MSDAVQFALVNLIALVVAWLKLHSDQSTIKMAATLASEDAAKALILSDESARERAKLWKEIDELKRAIAPPKP